LNEIAPDLILPSQTKTVLQLLEDLPEGDSAKLLDRKF
jgi:hypothetical protein